MLEYPEPYSKFPLAIYLTYGNVSFHVTLSTQLTLFCPLPMFIEKTYGLCFYTLVIWAALTWAVSMIGARLGYFWLEFIPVL